MSISAEASKVGVATINVSVSGGEAKSFLSGITAREVLQQSGAEDRPDVFAVLVGGVPMDLSASLTQSNSLERGEWGEKGQRGRGEERKSKRAKRERVRKGII